MCYLFYHTGTKPGHNDFAVQVNITENGFATAYLSMKSLSTGCPKLTFLQYNATERPATPMKCSRERGTNLLCRRLEQFSSLVAINDDQKFYSVYTDTQEITAVMETTNATITCHFTNGTLCKRCTLKLSRNNLPTEEITLLGDRDSLTGSGTGTIAGLIPGCSYSLIGKSDGARSPIEVEGKLLTKEEPDDGHSDPNFTAVWATVVAVLVCTMCAVVLLSLLVMMKRRKRGGVSVKRVSSFRAKVKAQTESKEMHIRKTEDNYLEVGPPLPPRTLDMFIPIADDNSTSTDSASTRSTDVTTEDTDSATATLNQHQMFPPTLDTISISSEAPPIPPQTADLLLDADVKSTPESTSSSSPKLPPTLQQPLASNRRLHAWQVSIHDPKSHKWFVFPRMLRQTRVNADSIPMHPNLSYETFAKNGCASY